MYISGELEKEGCIVKSESISTQKYTHINENKRDREGFDKWQRQRQNEEVSFDIYII